MNWTQAKYSPTDVVLDDNTVIATARYGLNGINHKQATTNAALIATAPELLNMVERMNTALLYFNSFYETSSMMKEVQELVAKAKGMTIT